MPELAALLSTLFLTAAASSLGWLARPYFPDSLESAERGALQILAGFGLLGLAFFLCGVIRFSFSTILAIIAAAFIPAILRMSKLKLQVPAVLGRLLHWEYALVAVVLLSRTIGALDLPRGDLDEISYHLFGPKMWLMQEAVHPVLVHSHTAFPATVEMLFAAGMGLSNPRSANLITVVFAVLTLIQAWGLSRRLGASAATARLTVLLAATTPTILARVGVGYIDNAFAAFALAAARTALEDIGPAATWPAVIVGASFAGFAAGTKYTGLIVAASLATLLLLPDGGSAKWARRLSRAAVFGFVALLVASPWYIRNFVELGSPIYPPTPALERYFPAKAFPPEAAREFQSYILNRAGGRYGHSLSAFLLLPFRITFHAEVFGGYAGATGFAILAFAPIGIVLLRRRRMAMRILAWVAILTIAWFFTQQERRFTIHLLIALTAFAAAGAAACLRQDSRAGRMIAIAALFTTIAHGAAVGLGESLPHISAVLSGRGNQLYDPSRLEGMKVVEYANRSTEVKRVLINGRHFKFYYLDKPYVAYLGEHSERPDPSIPDFATALRRAHELGITHVIDHQGQFELSTDFHLPSQTPPELELLLQDGPMRLYRIR